MRLISVSHVQVLSELYGGWVEMPGPPSVSCGKSRTRPDATEWPRHAAMNPY